MKYEDAIRQLQSLQSGRDLDNFERTLTDLYSQLEPASDDRFRLASRACAMLNSYDFGDHSRQMALLYHYADQMLAEVSTPPLEDELSLLSLLDQNFSSQVRKLYASRWLASLRQIEAERDPHFNFTDTPDLNVMPPAGGGVRVGTAPEHVIDPAARETYEAAIEANRQKAEKFNRQYQFHQLSEEFTPQAVRYIGRAYARPPASDEELRQLLDEQKATAQVRQAIWELLQKERHRIIG